MTDASSSNELDNLIGREIVVAPGNDTDLFSKGVSFDGQKYDERQAELNGLAKHYAEDPEGLVSELNNRIAKRWDDDFGLSFTHLSGLDLRGLKLKGVAEKIAISASDLRGANLEGAHLNAAIFTATNLDDVQARGADMDNVVAPAASFRGADLSHISSVDGLYNLAIFDEQTLLRGANMTNAYLIGAHGLTLQGLQSMARNVAARVIQKDQPEYLSSSETLRNALSARFTDVEGQEMPDLHAAKVIGGINLASKLLGSRRFDGAVLYDATLTGARLTDSNITGSFWNEIRAKGASLAGVHAAGLIVMDSLFEDVDARGIWLPGGLVVGSNLRGIDMTKANLGGTVFVSTDLRDGTLTDANMGGMVVIEGRAPALHGDQTKDANILKTNQLPEAVIPLVARLSHLAVGDSALQREIE